MVAQSCIPWRGGLTVTGSYSEIALPPLTLSQVNPLRNIRVLDHTGRYSHSVNKHTRKSLLKNHRAQELEDGSLQLFPPTIRVIESRGRIQIQYYTGNGWRVLPGMERPAYNLGIGGQGVIHYPVPAAYEGKLTRSEYEFCSGFPGI